MKGKHSAGESHASLPFVESPPTGFALLAKRISHWTTNLLASALVLVAALAGGRQVVQWWSADPSAVNPLETALLIAGTGTAWADTQGEQRLAFADNPYWLRRRVIHGDMAMAFAALRQSCRDSAPSGMPIQESMGPAEQHLLEQLGRSSPVEEHPGGCRLYQFEGSFPMVVATRQLVDQPAATAVEKVAGPVWRVVTWGFAVPTGERSWTLYALEAASPGSFHHLPQPALPPGARRVLALRQDSGGMLIAFRGHGQPADWARFYQGWFLAQGWSPSTTWRRSGLIWSARFRAPANSNAQWADVLFAPEETGAMKGIVSVALAAGR